MIQLASRASADRWWKLAFVIVCLAVAVAIAIKPAPKRRIVVTETTVSILDEVVFVGDTLSTPSLRTLDAVADTLIGNPSILLVEVQHTTLERAQAMVDYLVGQGVEAQRLDVGVNVDRPVGAFLIVTRAP